MEYRKRLEAKKDKWNKEKALKNLDFKATMISKQIEKRRQEDSLNSRKGQMNTKLNVFLRECSAEKDDLIVEYINFASELREHLVNYINTELKYNEKGIENISFEEIEELVNHLLKVFKKMKSISNNADVKTKYNPKAFTNYEKLLIDLIKLDGRFVLFAPKRVLEKSESINKISKLPQSLKQRMDIRLKKLKANEKWDYVAEKHVPLTAKIKRESEINSIISKISDKETDIISRYNKILKVFSNNIFDCVKQDIEINGLNNKEEIEECVNLFQILTLRDFCKNEKIKKINVFTPYETLFNKLIEIDVRFVPYAPVKCIKNADIDFDQLSKQEKNLINLKLEEDDGLIK